MKRILVGGSGGAPSINFVKSLKKSGEKFHLAGMSCNKYDLFKAGTDEKYLVPAAVDKDYIPALKSIIKDFRPDFLHVQNDAEVFVVSKHRAELDVKVFLPTHKTVDICVDKSKTYEKWQKAGLRVPKTFLVKSENDLKNAFDKFKGDVWLRIKQGAFGYGSLRAKNYEFARLWIENFKGWGKFCAAEYLSPDTITWLSIWKDGELVVAQGRKRLYWEFANRALSGVTGITGTGVTVSDKSVDDIALKAIYAVDKKPNGIFGVDLTYDKNNIPNPTEINIGRFFTTHLFFTEAGLNMPYIYLKLAFDEKLPDFKRKINPLPEGLAWVRGMDTEPVLTTVKEIEKLEQELKRRKQSIGK